MNNKYILILLVTLLVYINIYIPLKEKNQKLVKKITATEDALKKDKYYLAHRTDIVHDLNISLERNQQYLKKYFFQKDSSLVMNSMQKHIKAIIKKSGLHEDLITWGEKYNDKKNKIEIFPMSIRVSGSIKNIGRFFDQLHLFKKIEIKEYTITRTQKHYILRMSVFGAKRVQ